MIFQCKCCNYETDRKSSFDKHISSQKHILKSNNIRNEPNRYHYLPNHTNANVHNAAKMNNFTMQNVQDETKCKYCHASFSNKSSLTRHLHGRCKEKLRIETLEENKIELLENENKHLKKENNKLNKELEYFKELFKETTKSNKTSPSTITYVLNNYQDAPPLLCLDDYSQLNDSKNMDLVEVLIHHQENNKLDHFIGDYLIG